MNTTASLCITSISTFKSMAKSFTRILSKLLVFEVPSIIRMRHGAVCTRSGCAGLRSLFTDAAVLNGSCGGKHASRSLRRQREKTEDLREVDYRTMDPIIVILCDQVCRHPGSRWPLVDLSTATVYESSTDGIRSAATLQNNFTFTNE